MPNMVSSMHTEPKSNGSFDFRCSITSRRAPLALTTEFVSSRTHTPILKGDITVDVVMADVCQPPISQGLVSTFTLEMDDEVSENRPGGLLDPLRRSLNDVTAARLRRYHQQCTKRLDATLKLFRERQERERRSRMRCNRSPLTVSGSELHRTSLPGREARQWKLLRESSDIRVYRLRKRQQRTATVMATGTVHGSLGDVMNGLYADSTRTARVLQMLLSPRSLDARILQVDKSSTEAKPFQFSGIVWMALKIPGLGFCRHRDFLCFKKMDCFKNDLGEEMGFLVLHSIDPLADELGEQVNSFDMHAATGATWPPTSQSHVGRTRSASSSGAGTGHFVRGFISLAIVFKSVGDDRVAMFAHGHFNPSGRLPPLLGDSCIAEWLTSMANTVQSGQAKNLSLLLVRQKQNTSGMADHSTSRQKCGVCARSLFFWDAPRNCRGCWKPCCRTCRVTKPIFCAHYHTSGSAATLTSGPCTETFCLSCVCAVIPSGATINARLLKCLAKKRKRAPTVFRPTMTASSITDGSIAQQNLPVIATSERAERLLAAAEMSSISVLSSRESEKYQQHRLSLNARPKKRLNVQQQSDIADQDEDVDTPSTLLEVLEHYQVLRGGGAGSVISGVSSSAGGMSLRSFTSADLASTNQLGSFRLGRYPSGHSLLTHNNQSFYQRISVPARQDPMSLEYRGSRAIQAQNSFRLQHQQSNVRTKAKEPTPALDDEYYQRLLQNYLLHTNSTRSLASALSFGSYADKSMTTVPPPPISQESNMLSEPQSEPPSDARAVSMCTSNGGSSSLSPDVAVYRKYM